MTEQDLLAQPPADYMNEAQQGFFRELLPPVRRCSSVSRKRAKASCHACVRGW